MDADAKRLALLAAGLVLLLLLAAATVADAQDTRPLGLSSILCQQPWFRNTAYGTWVCGDAGGGGGGTGYGNGGYGDVGYGD